MAKFLIAGSYKPAVWAGQIAEPKNWIGVVQSLFEHLGGSIEAAYLAFGGTDLVCIVDMLDNVSAVAAGGCD